MASCRVGCSVVTGQRVCRVQRDFLALAHALAAKTWTKTWPSWKNCAVGRESVTVAQLAIGRGCWPGAEPPPIGVRLVGDWSAEALGALDVAAPPADLAQIQAGTPVARRLGICIIPTDGLVGQRTPRGKRRDETKKR